MDPEDLFGLALDEFIPRRAALAKELRAEGRRDEAKEVAATRKPSVAAWAVNQLVRTQGKAVDELFASGEAVRAAQDQVLAGKGDRQGLRAAAERERRSVQQLITAARGLLTSEGHELSPTVIERVSDTLHAAALDEEARGQVKGGRLQRELRHVGFGVPGGGAAAPPVSSSSARASQKGSRSGKGKGKGTEKGKEKGKGADAAAEQRGEDGREHRRAEREELRRAEREELRRAERERAEAVKAARAAEGEARRAAQRASRALEVAQERRERAGDALTRAERELDQARREADAAEDAHRAAAAELGQLTGRDRTV